MLQSSFGSSPELAHLWMWFRLLFACCCRIFIKKMVLKRDEPDDELGCAALDTTVIQDSTRYSRESRLPSLISRGRAIGVLPLVFRWRTRDQRERLRLNLRASLHPPKSGRFNIWLQSQKLKLTEHKHGGSRVTHIAWSHNWGKMTCRHCTTHETQDSRVVTKSPKIWIFLLFWAVIGTDG